MNHKLRTDMLTRGEIDQLDQALWHDPSAIGDDDLFDVDHITVVRQQRAGNQRVATHKRTTKKDA